MEKRWFNLMLTKVKLEYRCRLSQSMDSLGPIENTSVNEDPIIDDHKNWNQDDSSSYSNVDFLMDLGDVGHLISDDVFLVRDRNMDNYPIYFDIENQIFEIYKDHFYLSELEKELFSYHNSNDLNKGSKSEYDCYNYETQSSWNNHINRCIDSYLRSQIGMDTYILSGNENYSNSYIDGYIFSESESSHIQTSTNGNDFQNDTNLDITQKYKSLWIQCENCYELNYKRFLKSKMNICEGCGYHLKMNSSDRIELLIDPGTWYPMDEDMFSLDPIEFHSEEEPYKDRIDSYQRETGLTEAVQTGTGRLKGIPVAIGVMDFQFIGGSMGSVVGEKITRLIEYATDQLLPLIIVCASGGARMQEGSLSLMQMAKISSALYHYQANKKLLYVSILTSPTTGGVTASFGMLGDIIIAEPNAYIAFAGKRVIEQTLNKTIPEGSQEAEPLFEKGLFDLMVPRNILKGVLSELLQLHDFFPLNQNDQNEIK
uniref:Acetyl-coenzyme A carboxylase carboxyl transferase subunit beta, chloroplastic n=1 Tax=Zygophyllum xanthoxylum TaxID=90549 RepID=A0A7G9M1E6_9ROSI|nr:Acetyl-CoA carboxylase carboxyltransferase beta subunit [Zygophyllum xanthoxylum]QNM99164.1 Acetyl-CoA carboxylase carboxyltransferase beta subunit [Zygophyllum xanthoxylum]UZU70648.1 acetyl-CoA carboxylase carboxyltransferase beta subunit [Zygophyllum xanthoxylum]WFF46029.1 acetyl-CoA carboxylase carboxyltransferase beta subunit [Zygophyllum xanthoxylum]WFF46097.1 acetyl-CoA carboxylase carboxyltransferase beta subunit [Zygophyllum xanthoxylum]